MIDPTEPMDMEPVNFENWGKLVKTWSTGTNYLGDGQHYPVPKDLCELKQQLARAQTGVVLPPRIVDLDVVIGRSDRLLLRIPPANLLQAAETALQTQDYTLPVFYGDSYEGQAQTPLPDLPARLRFHAQRIGDYTIANCQ
ncbi:MAG: hypothetical protein JWP04_1826 [Belnapia sp.]|nr:hypothetical protein [Belnapia sp.]